MANPLGRNLKPGDMLVMENGAEVKVATTLLYGAHTFTSGSALVVVHMGEEVRCDSYDIDAKRTEARFAEKNGWTTPAPA